MLTFLNSAILFGLAAITIPILIHLFTRQKNKTVLFSSLKFLKELQKQKIRRLKIRQILLMILRTLFILALILAFARPTLKNSNSSSLTAGAQLTAVIILDNTMSMGREVEGYRFLETAKKRALEVVDLLRSGDEIYLLYPQEPPKFAHDGARYSPDSIRELIDNTELSFKKTDFTAAFALANQIMMNSSNINKEIYFISDMQKAGLDQDQSVNGASLLNEDITLLVLPVTGTGEENLGITSVSLENQILEKGKVIELKTSIKNFGSNNVHNSLVHLFVNGKRVGQQDIDLAAQSSESLTFRFVPDQTGFQSGYILLEDDDLFEDNRRYFMFRVPDEISVLLLGNSEQDTRYLNLALRPQNEIASFLKVDKATIIDFGELIFEEYDVIVLSNLAKLNNTETRKLQQFVSKGGGLMVFLGANVDLRNYNDGLHKRLNLPLLTQSTTKIKSEEFLSFGKIDFSHPIFRGVFEEEKSVESPHIRFSVQVSSDKPLDKIIEYSNGEPFLFEARLQKGNILYSTTGISQDWSDLIYRGFFVPLVSRAVSYLAGTASLQNDEMIVGNDLTYSSENLSSGSELAILKPDESEVKIKPAVQGGNYLIKFIQTDIPGIYKLYGNNQVITQWAVNPAPIESESAVFETSELAEFVKAEKVSEISAGEKIVEAVQTTRFGRELWKGLVAFALVLLLLEMALLKERQKLETSN